VLRKGFGWFVLAMGAFVLVQQLPEAARWPAAAGIAVLAVAVAACWRFVAGCPLRRLDRSPETASAPAAAEVGGSRTR
jgi:hypothetical protein